MGNDTKRKWKQMSEDLGYARKCVWDTVETSEHDKIIMFGEEYKTFLNQSKTEREAVREILKIAANNGFQSIEKIIASRRKLVPGDKVYFTTKEKNVALVVVGKEPISNGLNIVGSHLDSPRLDLKPLPLYEDQGLALFKTHYYGGIKKYHWLSHPLALHGVIIKETGEKIEVVIGEKEDEPTFLITDLLPHLAKEQMQKKISEAISGESLNVLIGSIPQGEKELSDRVKLAILELLNTKYDITEEDFTSAELELVPSTKARDVGLDRSMIGSYGQDDRICAFTSLQAILSNTVPQKTAMSLFVDKEEIGSTGNTGMKSRFFENTVAELIDLTNEDYNEIDCRRALANSRALSADVGAGIDPNYEGVLEKNNAAKLGFGVIITKYTGSGGKYSTSDANPEFIAGIRGLFNAKKVVWQTGELGKVDQGGGGTIAQFIAKYGMEVLDCGPALLSMHSPMEISHKADLYMCFKAYEAFLMA